MPPCYTCTFLFLCLVAAFQFPSGGAAPSIVDQFEKWIVATGRRYKDKAEKDARFKIFKSNVEYIDAFNRNVSNTFNLGVNQFADLTLQEYGKMVDMGPPPKIGKPGNNTLSWLQHVDVANVPENVDWRSTGGVTPAKNQVACGACWAFCTVAAVETLNHMITGKLLSLSEQQVIDCAVRKPGELLDGCKGGTVQSSYQHMIRNNGIALSKDYPYVMRGTDPCDARRVGHNAPITGFEFGPTYSEVLLKLLVSTRPVTIAMQIGTTEFEYFTGDSVWNFRGACGGIWHCLTLIGYGVEPDGTKYWLVKNSFGKLWGNNGFAKIAREVPGAGPGGVCSMASYVTYPNWNVG